MSWSNIRELILQERKAIDSPPVMEFPQETVFETQHSALLACYLRTKDEVDAAALTFAQTLEWPEMSPLVRFFMAARLEFAWEVASILGTGHEGEGLIQYPVGTQCKTCELLEWLLIDIWPYGCGRFLQSQRSVAEPAQTAVRMATPISPRLAKAECAA
jgi:hypothetical protein